MAKKSITKRWIINNLGVMILALLVIAMAIIYAVQSYFYSSAKQYLVSKINAVTSVLSVHSQDSASNFSAEMRNMLETFNEKDKIELMAINSKGRVVLTSSGFSPDADMLMPDYEDAMTYGEGSYVGKLPSGEKNSCRFRADIVYEQRIQLGSYGNFAYGDRKYNKKLYNYRFSCNSGRYRHYYFNRTLFCRNYR